MGRPPKEQGFADQAREPLAAIDAPDRARRLRAWALAVGVALVVVTLAYCSDRTEDGARVAAMSDSVVTGDGGARLIQLDVVPEAAPVDAASAVAPDAVKAQVDSGFRQQAMRETADRAKAADVTRNINEGNRKAAQTARKAKETTPEPAATAERAATSAEPRLTGTPPEPRPTTAEPRATTAGPAATIAGSAATPPEPAVPTSGSAAPISRPAAPAARAAAPPAACETMDIDETLNQAKKINSAGHAKAALQLVVEALGCRQNGPMYRDAVTYACAANDVEAAKRHFARLPQGSRTSVAKKCKQAGLDLSSP